MTPTEMENARLTRLVGALQRALAAETDRAYAQIEELKKRADEAEAQADVCNESAQSLAAELQSERDAHAATRAELQRVRDAEEGARGWQKHAESQRDEARAALADERKAHIFSHEKFRAALAKAEEELQGFRIGTHIGLIQEQLSECMDENSKTKAALGRAVAALQEVRNRNECAAPWDGDTRFWLRKHCDTILADPTCAAAGEYVRDLQRLVEISCAPGCSHEGCDGNYNEYQRLSAKVAARRGQ